MASSARVLLGAVIGLLICAFPRQSEAAEIDLKTLTGPPPLTLIIISGDLRPGDKERFLNIALQTEKAVVVLGSPGGNLLAGLDIGQAIRLRGYATYVPDNVQCASACALAWLGGSRRFMSRSAQIGFHAAFSSADPTNANGAANAVVGAYLNSLGLSQSAVIYITSARPTSMSWMSFEEAGLYGIDVKELNINASTVPSTPYNSPPIASTSPAEPSAAITSNDRVMAVTSDQLTLRDQPNAKARALIAINGGARVSVIDDSPNGWKHIRLFTNGLTYSGFVNGRYLTSDVASIVSPLIIAETADLLKPSFCGKENEPIEEVLCSNDDISEQESAMEKSYYALIAQMGAASDAIKASQRKWLADRRTSCSVPEFGKMPKPIPVSVAKCVQAMTDQRKHNLRRGIY